MDKIEGFHGALERIVLDPKYHDALSLVKGVRNGIVYGSKVRFPHALVMIFLFRSGTFREKVTLVLKATKQHARNLGLFCLIYKSTMMLLRHVPTGSITSTPPSSLTSAPNVLTKGVEGPYDSFFAGLLGGYYVFGRRNTSVNQQIVIYVFARVCLALAKLSVKPAAAGGLGLFPDPVANAKVRERAWPVFASLSWAMVMFLFRWNPDVVQGSLRSSMQYIYRQSDDWDSLRTLVWHNK